MPARHRTSARDGASVSARGRSSTVVAGLRHAGLTFGTPRLAITPGGPSASMTGNGAVDRLEHSRRMIRQSQRLRSHLLIHERGNHGSPPH
jgi:hypothetical protein